MCDYFSETMSFLTADDSESEGSSRILALPPNAGASLLPSLLHPSFLLRPSLLPPSARPPPVGTCRVHQQVREQHRGRHPLAHK